MISTCMLKICGESILKSTELISKSCNETEKFIYNRMEKSKYCPSS